MRILSPKQILQFEERILPPRADFVPQFEKREIQEFSKRCGVIAIKVGMMIQFSEWGERRPVTVLWIDECQVTQVKLAEYDRVTALQVGCGWLKDSKTHVRMAGHCVSAGVPYKSKFAEFRVTRDALLNSGTHITAAHFIPGQPVDITGITWGYGFQGVMRRWNFAGGHASHGRGMQRGTGSLWKKNHPSKPQPGKKLAGQTGGEKRIQYDINIFKVDPARNLLYIDGPVPGHPGNYVLVRDSKFMSWEVKQNLPFPTWNEKELPPVGMMTRRDPYHHWDTHG